MGLIHHQAATLFEALAWCLSHRDSPSLSASSMHLFATPLALKVRRGYRLPRQRHPYRDHATRVLFQSLKSVEVICTHDIGGSTNF